MVVDFNKNNGGGSDLTNYWTSAQTESAITVATSEIESHLDDVERVTSIAINDLNDKIDNYSGGSADLTNYWTSAQTESAIEEATENLVTSGEVQTQIEDSLSGVTVDLSGYYTSAQTENTIVSKGYVTSGDTVFEAISVAINDVQEEISELNYVQFDDVLDGNTKSIQQNKPFFIGDLDLVNDSTRGIYFDSEGEIGINPSVDTDGDTGDKFLINDTLLATKDEIGTIPSYYDDGEQSYVTFSSLSDALAGANVFITDPISGNYVVNPIPDTSAFLTSADTQNFVTSAYTGFASASDFNTLSGYVQTNDMVTASALTELHEEISAMTSSMITSGQVETQIVDYNALQHYVNSTDITHIEKISQAAYDALVSGGTVVSTTWYLITGTTV